MVAVFETSSPAKPRGRLAGDANIWVFVLADLFSFAFYFVVYMVYRVKHGRLFLESQRQLDLRAGTVNTLVLLASSCSIALAVEAVRTGKYRRGARLVSVGALGGVLFTVIKAFEWHHEIVNGFTLPRNDFFMFYFMLTGVHLFHVLLGLLILGWLRHEMLAPGLRRVSVVEAGAVYWHMVDVVWIVLFALLYLTR